MGTNDIVLKARQLNEAYDCDGVVELLENYVKDNIDDTEAFALYQKSLALKTLVDSGVSTEKLFDNVSDRYQGIPEKDVLCISHLLFTYEVSELYLSDRTKDEKANLILAYLESQILSLGDRLNDYNILKKQLDGFYNTMACFGFDGYIYQCLSLIIDWHSKVSENIMLYIVEKVEPLIAIATDKAIYDAYTKDMKENVFPISEMPKLRDGRADAVESKEAKEFWQGYFAFAKKVREEEYADYKKIAEDANHKSHPAYFAYTYLYNASRKNLKNTTPEFYGEYTKCINRISVISPNYEKRINDADRLFKCIYVNPITQIKAFINKIFKK